MQRKPWGVFDSGLGGLTVLRSLALQFPFQSFIYIGDTARVPYGGKSPATIRQYSLQILEELHQKNIQGIIVACNTASTQLPEDEYKEHPLLKVIMPGALAAVEKTQNKKIGVIGTRATIQSQAYTKAIHVLDETVEVFVQDCPLFVPLVEEGWTKDPLTNLIVFRYLQPLMSTGIDTLILGCTHYPLLREAIQKVTGQTLLVESGEALGNLMRSRWPELESTDSSSSTDRSVEVFLTDYSVRSENLVREFLNPVEVTGIYAHNY